MKSDDYQNAFSRLEPGQAAVEAVLQTAIRQEARKRPRLGSVLVAATLVVLLLTGTVFAATQFHWFSLGGAETYTYPVNTDPEAFGKAEQMPPAARGLLSFDDVTPKTYVGFSLPDSYLEGRDSRNCWKLGGSLYRRYYRNPRPDDPDSPLLTVEILDADQKKMLTRYPTETVKEELINGFETVWVQINGAPDGRTQYCLFQKNAELGCVAAITSTVSFADAEQAARDISYEDSGIPIEPGEEIVRYGYKLDQLPAGWELNYHDSLADKWQVANATLADPEQDLTEAWTGAYFIRTPGDQMFHLSISLKENQERFDDYAPNLYRTIYKTGTLYGYEARWIYQNTNEDRSIQVLIPEYRVQLTISVGGYEMDAENAAIPIDEALMQEAEHVLETLEIVPVPIAEEAPSDFMPFAVG